MQAFTGRAGQFPSPQPRATALRPALRQERAKRQHPPPNRSPKCPQQRSGNDWEEGRKWLRRHGTSYFRRGGRAGVRLLPEAPVCRVPRWRRGCTWSTTWTVRAAGAGPRAAAEDGRADCASGRGLSPAWALAEPRLPRARQRCPMPGCEASRSCEGSRPRSLPPSFLPSSPRRGVLGLLRGGGRGSGCTLVACCRAGLRGAASAARPCLRPWGRGAALSACPRGSCRLLLLLGSAASGAFLGSLVVQRWWNEAEGNFCVCWGIVAAAAFADILKMQPYFGYEY